MTSDNASVPVLPAAAIAFCCAGLVTAFIGLRDVIGTGSSAKLWLVLFVAAGIAALVLLRTARDDRGRVRLGVGWAALGAIVVATTIDSTPNPGPGAPIGSGWAVLVAGGAAVLLSGALLAVSPILRPATNRVIIALAVIMVCVIQVGGYAVAVQWTDGQNVHLTVADAAPLQARESVLDGRVQWSSRLAGAQVASAGGVLTASTNGMQMLDPATGTPRWTYRRADVAQVINPVASSDGTLVGAIALVPSLNPKPTPQGATERLIVLNAMTGAVVTDSPLDPRVQGALGMLGSTDAYFDGGPDGIRNVQISAVKLTGPQAGRQDWVYYPKDGCDINAVSALDTQVALSTTCGTIAMLNTNGTPRWVFRTPTGGAQIWPLAGSPAGTVQAVTEREPVSDPAGYGVSAPSGVLSLDARTGAVRWQDDSLPKAPFMADSTDAATGSMATIWAGGTGVLVYALPNSREVWLAGYRRAAVPSTWDVTVPNMTFSIQAPQTVGDYVGATPDGRILLPTQNIESSNDLNAHPGMTVVRGRDGSVTPNVAFDGADGIAETVGFFGPPVVLPTPGGVVLAIAGVEEQQPAPGAAPPFLLVGLH